MKNPVLSTCLFFVFGSLILTACNKNNDTGPQENIVYQDNFDNNSDNRWPIGNHDEVQAAFKMENGQYYIQNKKAATFYMGINRFTPPATDTLGFEIKVRLDSSALESPDYGIWLYQENPSSAIAAFYINEKGQFSVVVAKTDTNGNSVAAYQKAWTASGTIRPGEYNALRIARMGGTYTFLVNGKQVDQTPDLGALHLNLPALVVGPLTSVLVDYVKVTR